MTSVRRRFSTTLRVSVSPIPATVLFVAGGRLFGRDLTEVLGIFPTIWDTEGIAESPLWTESKSSNLAPWLSPRDGQPFSREH
jgi:hypothetical protein